MVFDGGKVEVTCTGQELKLVCGSASILLKSDGTVEINGSKEVGLGAQASTLKLEGAGATLSGPKVTSSAIGVHEITSRVTNFLDKASGVDILFKKKFQKLCSDSAALTKEYGARQAGVLRRRLDDLRAAKNLAELRHAPGRLHLLTADLRGAFSIDLVHPYRLIFECANSPAPLSENGTLDWERITAIEIRDVVDTHE